MTDERYTALVKAAYEAQQAREGEVYQRLTAEVAEVDRLADDLQAEMDRRTEALRQRREAASAALEEMDDAVTVTRMDLDDYFSGREAHPNTEARAVINGDDELFDESLEDHTQSYEPEPIQRWPYHAHTLSTASSDSQSYGAEPELEFNTARNSGAQ